MFLPCQLASHAPLIVPPPPAGFEPCQSRLILPSPPGPPPPAGFEPCQSRLILPSPPGPPPSAGFEPCQSRLIRILERLTGSKERDLQPEYLYYGIPSPWLQVGGGRGGGRRFV